MHDSYSPLRRVAVDFWRFIRFSLSFLNLSKLNYFFRSYVYSSSDEEDDLPLAGSALWLMMEYRLSIEVLLIAAP